MFILKVKKGNGVLLDHGRFNSAQEGLTWFQSFIDKGVYGQDFTIETEEEEIVEVVDNSVQEAINDAARKLLAETDWYLIREFETGIACSQEIKDARQAARDSIV